MRVWNELVAVWDDVFSLALTEVILLVLALIIAILWFMWPSWWNALRRIRLGRGRKRTKEHEALEFSDEELDAVADSDEELPAVDPALFASLADRFAAQGQFAEAVRERLRSMVRALVTSGVITHHPGWTVTELAREAGTSRAATGPPVAEASVIFSEIWYAKVPALSEHDARMRGYADQLTAELAGGRK
ncbi:DUF4129 domain-containing protein [Catelliglobosispora koreensis]|uniref:DUF4129 domain-containing protein n=1 Tax=Catelliglobosispora koreensis TaxID=129052 RepID=UPI00035D9677|nr:DUF4129 domain-containing protein [Catelliglobosispora koreensis]